MQQMLASVVRDVFGLDVPADVTRPDSQFGDYATNVALQLAGRLHKPPRDIAEQLARALKERLAAEVADVTVAGPGFVNITLSDQTLAKQALAAPTTKPQLYAGQVIVAEYSDPNPFKVLHAGHLYTSMVGYAMSNLMAAAGANVHRVNFGGDVGLHVGKTMWAILRELGGEHPEKLAAIPPGQHAEWMAKAYVAGTNAYEDDETAKAEIVALNKRVYQLFDAADHESPFARIYWTCRQWSYDYFNAFYARIGTPFEKYYPESEVSGLGLRTVREQLAKGVFKESDGAVVFEGEPYGLHTRVFINSQGIPTYEAKDVGLIMQKWADYHFDRSVVITGSEQEQYMAVVLKAIEQFSPELSQTTSHVTHGLVKLQGGVKMSSRKGNILRAVDVLEAAHAANKQATGRDDEQAVLGAVKYAFLKQRIGPDIIYNPAESVAIDGNSGPYLQYAHARARSILSKVSSAHHPRENGDPVHKESLFAGWVPGQTGNDGQLFDNQERPLSRKIGEYPEVLEKAARDMLPHHICTYLYELAQVFNRFYENAKVAGDPREATRLVLVRLYADTLKDGLGILGIAAPDTM